MGLKKKQYCILNKQYTKEEYEKLRARIIEQMNVKPYIDAQGREYKYGEFFPPEFCPWGYNETVAQEYFPMSKTEAVEKGWPWRDQQTKAHEATLSWKDLPGDVADVADDITKQIILCRAWDEEGEEKALEHNCSKAFRIIPEELAFYKRMRLPFPQYCFNSRHNLRSRHRNPVVFHRRKCQCAGGGSENGVYRNTATAHVPHNFDQGCPIEFQTSYASNRPETVYCEQCYQAEVA